MKALSELTHESEQYFAELKLHEGEAKEAYHHILITVDKALKEQNIANLLSLISYIENGNGQLAYKHIGKTRIFLRLLHIIDIENKYQRPLFFDGCNDANMLIEKYRLTIFAFRRLIFHLSDVSASEAVYYLQNHPISHFAAYTICHDELMIPNQTFYEILATIYRKHWSETDTQQFFSLTQQV